MTQLSGFIAVDALRGWSSNSQVLLILHSLLCHHILFMWRKQMAMRHLHIQKPSLQCNTSNSEHSHSKSYALKRHFSNCLLFLQRTFPSVFSYSRGPSTGERGDGSMKTIQALYEGCTVYESHIQVWDKSTKTGQSITICFSFSGKGKLQKLLNEFSFFKNISLRPLYHFLCGYFESLESLCSCFSSSCGSFCLYGIDYRF